MVVTQDYSGAGIVEGYRITDVVQVYNGYRSSTGLQE